MTLLWLRDECNDSLFNYSPKTKRKMKSMKKLLWVFLALALPAVFTSCDDDDNNDSPSIYEYDGVVFNTAEGERYSNTNYNIVLKDSLSGKTLTLDMYCTGYKYLPSGTYSVKGTAGSNIGKASREYAIDQTGNYIGNNLRYTNYKSDSTTMQLLGGTVEVTANVTTKEYTFEVDVLLSDSTRLKGKYEGKVSGVDIFDEWTLSPSACVRMSVNDPVPGEFYLKLNDSNWTFEMVLQLFAEASATELPAGTYEWADTKAPGTIGAKTSIDTYSLPVAGGYIKSGKAVVSKDSLYTIAFDLTAEDGQRYVGTYTGDISNMDLAN